MTRTFGTAFAICALLFFLVLSVVFLVRLNDGRNDAISAADAHFAEVRQDILVSPSNADSSRIAEVLSTATSDESLLRAVAVYTFDGGLEYLWARNRAYLADDLDALPVPLAPEFTFDRVSEISLTDRIRRPDGRTVIVESVYRVVSEDMWYRLIRDTLLAVLVFTSLTVLVAIGVLLAARTPDPAVARTQRPNRTAPGAATVTPAGRSADLFNPESGVGFEAHLARRLTLELERAASNDQDLAFALARFPGLSRGTEGYRSCARAMVERFLFEDLIFEQGIDGFAVLLPSTDLNQAIKQFDSFFAEIRSNPLPGRPFFGITARSGRLVESDRLIREAQHALMKAQSEQRSIIAFRADPQKYRDYVSEQAE